MWVLVFGMMLPIRLAAQAGQPSSSPASPPLLNEQQRSGEALFLQNCGLCHAPITENRKDSKIIPKPRATSLAGMFRRTPPVRDDVVRIIIQQGVAKKMPGFQYTLSSKELDDILAYLKTM